MTFPERVLQTKFNDWLNTPIYTSKGFQVEKRDIAILDFIDDLLEFIQYKGYAFRENRLKIAKDWARFVFLIQQKSFRKIQFQLNPDAIANDFDIFNDTFTYEVVESFLEKYQFSEVFAPDSLYGPRIVASVFPFIWYYVDVNRSKTIRNMETDSDSDNNEFDYRNKKRSDDPYLADQANSSSKFNRWD